MKETVISFIAGLVIGLIYASIKVRSPAPPLVALAGLLGILIGEFLMPVIKRHAAALLTRF